MYDECLNCPKLGTSCDGPNFFAMNAHEIIDWCKTRKSILDLTNQEVADLSNTPKGTVDGIFAGKHYDFKYETMRPLIRVFVGGSFDGNPCPAPEENGMAEKLAMAEEAMQKMEQEHKEHILRLKNEHRKEKIVLSKRAKTLTIIAVVFAVLLFVALSAICGALIYDYMNTHIGFFWIE